MKFFFIIYSHNDVRKIIEGNKKTRRFNMEVYRYFLEFLESYGVFDYLVKFDMELPSEASDEMLILLYGRIVAVTLLGTLVLIGLITGIVRKILDRWKEELFIPLARFERAKSSLSDVSCCSIYTAGSLNEREFPYLILWAIEDGNTSLKTLSKLFFPYEYKFGKTQIKPYLKRLKWRGYIKGSRWRLRTTSRMRKQGLFYGKEKGPHILRAFKLSNHHS